MDPLFLKSAPLARETELLLEAQSPWARARLLVRLALDSCGATAAALCRRGGDGIWRRVASLGEGDALPSLAQVAACAEGRLPEALPPQRLVLSAPEGLALALGGIDPDAPARDGIEALLLVYGAVTKAHGMDEIGPPFSA